VRPSWTALTIEWTKARHSPVGVVTSLLLVLGTVAVTGASLASVGADGMLAAKSEVLVGDGGWAGLFGLAGQVVAAGGLLGCGVMVGWLYGREFTDGTVAALFARPVPLRAVAQAKLALYLLWVLAVSSAVTLGVLALGAGLTVSGAEGFASGGAARPAAVLWVATVLWVAFVLTGLLALPCAWVATRTGGYLAGVGAAVVLVVLAQMTVLLGAGGWFPFAAPGWWVAGSGATDALSVLQLALVLPVAAVAGAATVRSWGRLSL
jgi:ABC-2 type transport system permease protein